MSSYYVNDAENKCQTRTTIGLYAFWLISTQLSRWTCNFRCSEIGDWQKATGL